MDIVWGLVIIALGLLAWVGQTVVLLAPELGVRLSLVESEASVEPVYWADIRGEALWDALSLWTLPLAGVLLLAGHESWAWFGLIGGGMYLYFGGRGLLTRLELRRRGHRIGEPGNVRMNLAMCAVWAIAGGITAIAAITALS